MGTEEAKGEAVGLSGTGVVVGDGGAAVGALSAVHADAVASAPIIRSVLAFLRIGKPALLTYGAQDSANSRVIRAISSGLSLCQGTTTSKVIGPA